MTLVLFDTARAARVPFPVDVPHELGIYSCGPTVHGRKHLGELRQYVVVDVLKRRLASMGRRTRHVINITDVGHLTDDADLGEDRVLRAARRAGESVTQTARHFTRLFQRDLALLGVSSPQVWATASEHVLEQIQMAVELERRGLTYLTKDGLYFDTSRAPGFGKLARASGIRTQPQLRIVAADDRRHPDDFLVWRRKDAETECASDHDEGNEAQSSRSKTFDSPWGRGIPGWHVECAAMAQLYAGPQIALHTGTTDHIHSHHDHELAQAEQAFDGKPWVRHWLHVAPVLVASEQPDQDGATRTMADHAKNSITVDDVMERGLAPRICRLLLLSTHYRSKLVVSWSVIATVASQYERLARLVAELKPVQAEPGHTHAVSRNPLVTRLKRLFERAIDDDLQTPRALSVLWETLKHPLLSAADKLTVLSHIDSTLGLGLLEAASLLEVPASPSSLTLPIMQLIDRRNEARNLQDFALADALRTELQRLGFNVEDHATGTRIRARSLTPGKAEAS
ncbi:MAG TPA: hypothetical protein VFQ61_29610 [Polyangiaceae bacterium]|nr:hypothetical protein [Polyangiaceae bacterium]